MQRFKSITEENDFNKNDCIDNMKAYLNNLVNYKERLNNLMKVTKDKNKLDDFLDIYSELDKTMKKMASFYAISAILFDMKNKDVNSLCDSRIHNTVIENLNQVDYIDDDLKQFIVKHNLIQLIISHDFNIDAYLNELVDRLQHIMLNKF